MKRGTKGNDEKRKKRRRRKKERDKKKKKQMKRTMMRGVGHRLVMIIVIHAAYRV